MAITPKIKLLRVLSVLQCWIAVWLFVLGIVEQVRVSWNHSGLALAIWISLWVIILKFTASSCVSPNTLNEFGTFAAIVG